MSELDKYQDFFANDLTELVKKTDIWVKQGYKVLSTEVLRTGITPLILRTMYLSSTVDLTQYKGFENVDIGSPRQTELEKMGYEGIANYSKHITWAKPNEKNIDALDKEIDILAKFMDWIDDEPIRLTVDGLIGDYYRAKTPTS